MEKKNNLLPQTKSAMSSHDDINIAGKDSCPFLFLPYDLRRMIYMYSFSDDSRRPPAEYVHEKILSEVWTDKLSPLLQINKQIRAEVFCLLRKYPITRRITWQDARFDALGLSSFIVKKHQKSFEDIPHLVVEIWPPHPDRPIDQYRIYQHLRKVRRDLQHIPRVSKLDVVFLENNIATWSSKYGPLQVLDPLGRELGEFMTIWDDVSLFMEQFDGLVNVATAHIHLPDSITRDGLHSGIENDARRIEDNIKLEFGQIGMKDGPWDIADEILTGQTEFELRHDTAEIAMAKLNFQEGIRSRVLSKEEFRELEPICAHLKLLEWCKGRIRFGEWGTCQCHKNYELPYFFERRHSFSSQRFDLDEVTGVIERRHSFSCRRFDLGELTGVIERRHSFSL